MQFKDPTSKATTTGIERNCHPLGFSWMIVSFPICLFSSTGLKTDIRIRKFQQNQHSFIFQNELESKVAKARYVQVPERWILITLRKVPTDLTEGSTCGTILTFICYALVAILIGFEFNNFLTVESTTYRFSVICSKNGLHNWAT